jgi:hypothetical protein
MRVQNEWNEFMKHNGIEAMKWIQWNIKLKQPKGCINGVLMKFNGIPSRVERIKRIQLNSMTVGRIDILWNIIIAMEGVNDIQSNQWNSFRYRGVP